MVYRMLNVRCARFQHLVLWIIFITICCISTVSIINLYVATRVTYMAVKENGEIHTFYHILHTETNLCVG
jgi:hypothetical protein